METKGETLNIKGPEIRIPITEISEIIFTATIDGEIQAIRLKIQAVIDPADSETLHFSGIENENVLCLGNYNIVSREGSLTRSTNVNPKQMLHVMWFDDSKAKKAFSNVEIYTIDSPDKIETIVKPLLKTHFLPEGKLSFFILEPKRLPLASTLWIINPDNALWVGKTIGTEKIVINNNLQGLLAEIFGIAIQGPPREESKEPFTMLSEAITELKTIIPAEIQKRYLIGRQWGQLVSSGKKSLENDIEGPNGLILAKLYLAAYLINIVSQNLLQELVSLTREEMQTIKTTVKNIIEFVLFRLGISLSIDLETGYPKVFL